MSTKCMKIKLRDGSLPTVDIWQEKLNAHRNEVVETLRSEGVSLEAVFLDRQSDGDYLIYVMRSDDFDRVSDVASRSTSHIDEFHRAFKESCWETRVPLRPLVDFAADTDLANS